MPLFPTFPPFFRRYYQRLPAREIKNIDTKINNSDEFIESSSIKEKNADLNPHFFNFLGITLQSDDILILFLLFFLYNEGVEDDILYIILILLLIG